MGQDRGFEDWKAELAATLERVFGWSAGRGLRHVEEEAPEVWRDAYDNGLTPKEMAELECASLSGGK